MKKLITKAFSILNNHKSHVPAIPEGFAYIPPGDYRIEGDYIFFKKLSLQIPIKQADPLITGYSYAIVLVEKANGLFSYTNNQLLLCVAGLQFIIHDFEELFILKEVLAEGCYNIFSPSTNIVAIDIGMNVAVTSLFLSAKENIEKVYGFELFRPTFELALKNIALNITGRKIIPVPYGLGKENKSMILPYSTERKGRMGLFGIQENSNVSHTTMQETEVRSASVEIGKIIAAHPHQRIMCKIDCEGAEYEIIGDLNEKNILNKVHTYMIEWHFRKPDTLLDIFTKNGYTLICLTHTNTNDFTGMLYAVRDDIK